MNKIGPKIVHWGIPLRTSGRCEKNPFSFTLCFLNHKNDFIQLTHLSDTFVTYRLQDDLWHPLLTCWPIVWFVELSCRSSAAAYKTSREKDWDYIRRVVKVSRWWNIAFVWCPWTCRCEWNWDHQVGHQHTTYDKLIISYHTCLNDAQSPFGASLFWMELLLCRIPHRFLHRNSVWLNTHSAPSTAISQKRSIRWLLKHYAVYAFIRFIVWSQNIIIIIITIVVR